MTIATINRFIQLLADAFAALRVDAHIAISRREALLKLQPTLSK
ncbi:MAG TPA: hypothetical protein VIK35_00730 [Verrucomicrobiae bacterium]